VAPSKGLIPFSTDEDCRGKLWDLTAKRKGAIADLPRRSHSRAWANNLLGWAHFLDTDAEELEEAWTLAKLCKEVDAKVTVDGLQEDLAEGEDAFEWLNELHALVTKVSREELFDQMRLIPNQGGGLRRAKDLKRDPGIDNDLKDIAERLNYAVRAELVDTRI